ncbi:unnamed protein product [Fraxinus pennsylvanica]|uniref:Uncharacterized protein n=1 Tax=Fraxinus pennsylvanica TaxID=56036 RepID=A0AAD2A308_9LAMI|nr:unnamed protein product [Fraxinus pennsylvanica]
MGALDRKRAFFFAQEERRWVSNRVPLQVNNYGPGLDLNASPGGVDIQGREEMFPVPGGISKRKEPERGGRMRVSDTSNLRGHRISILESGAFFKPCNCFYFTLE